MNGAGIRGVIFDLDGLLVDSEPVQIQAWETFLARYSLSLAPDLLQRMFGLRIWDSARLLVDELALPLSVDEVVSERDAVFFDLLPGRLLAMPGASTTVRELAARSYRLALATSGHRRYVDVVLSELQLAGLFEAEITGDMVSHGKPSPDIYRAAATRLDLLPASCVALEDAPIGIASAKAAGMTCLAIPNDMTRHLTGIDHADAILAGLDEVVPWLVARQTSES